MTCCADAGLASADSNDKATAPSKIVGLVIAASLVPCLRFKRRLVVSVPTRRGLDQIAHGSPQSVWPLTRVPQCQNAKGATKAAGTRDGSDGNDLLTPGAGWPLLNRHSDG